MSRPEWVKCIADVHQDRIGQALCGRVVGFARLVDEVKVLTAFEFAFTSIDHWFLASLHDDRLTGCHGCLAKIQAELTKGLQ